MAKVIDLSDFSGCTDAFRRAVASASSTLKEEEHDNDCPVRHGASADCCWPIAVCVPDNFLEKVKR